MPICLLTTTEVAVEEEISEELSEETWLSEMNIEEVIEETILESNAIWETIQEAIEEHRADAEDAVKEDAVKEANVLTAPVLTGSGLEVATETISAGEEAIGLHGIPPAQAEPETAAGLAMARYEHVTTTAGVQQAVDCIEPRDSPDPAWLTAFYCKLDEDGRERQELPLLASPTLTTPESLGQGQGSMIPGQQALHVARQCMQISHTDAEICQVVCTLAVALGASRNRRTEAGTIKALHAVLRLLQRPEMSEEEACTSTGASTSSFKRWQKHVQSAQLGVSLP